MTEMLKKAKQCWVQIHTVIKNIPQLNITIEPELFLLGLIDKELEKIGNWHLYITMARVLYSKSWKINKIQ